MRIYAALLIVISIPSLAEPQIYFIQNDHLGTPQALYDSDQDIVWKADYKPFGEATIDQDPDGDNVDIVMPIRFPGQYYDNETGLHYNYYRDYDPSLGRYIQSDPIGLRGGLNTYGYVGGNPLRYVDPFGLHFPSADAAVSQAVSSARGYANYSREPHAALAFKNPPSLMNELFGHYGGDYDITDPSKETVTECAVFTDAGGFKREHVRDIDGAVGIGLAYPSDRKYPEGHVQQQAQDLANRAGVPVHYVGGGQYGVVNPQ